MGDTRTWQAHRARCSAGAGPAYAALSGTRPKCLPPHTARGTNRWLPGAPDQRALLRHRRLCRRKRCRVGGRRARCCRRRRRVHALSSLHGRAWTGASQQLEGRAAPVAARLAMHCEPAPSGGCTITHSPHSPACSALRHLEPPLHARCCLQMPGPRAQHEVEPASAGRPAMASYEQAREQQQ